MTDRGESNFRLWTIHVNIPVFNINGSSVEFIIENNEEIAMEFSLNFDFVTTSNKAECNTKNLEK